jgi:pilus assembly protein CpaE
MRLINALSLSKGWPGSLLDREDGTSAVEFSLFLPLILFGCLTMGDIALAVHQRMTLDHVVRAGGQVAMTDPGEDRVLSALKSAASKNFAVGSSSDDVDRDVVSDPVTVEVARYCSCPSNRSASVSCSDPCSETTPPFVFYRMSAAKSYDGIFIPAFSLGSDLNVQIR